MNSKILPTLTVFTPTYNRGYCLNLGYEGLKRQTCKDFKWLIIDDGSTDNTKDLVDYWNNEAFIDIEYFYQENGGKHIALNTAYSLIETELNVCIDSDDFMTDNAVELILNHWRMFGNKRFAGLVGLDIYKNGSIVGTKFPKGLNECKSYDLKRKYGVLGDKTYVYRTELMKELDPYPKFDNEKFVPPNYKFQQLDLKFDLLCFNQSLTVVEYMPDGSSLNIINLYLNNPKGFAHERKILMQIFPCFLDRFKYAMHYVSSSILSKNNNFLREAPNKNLVVIAIPFGIILHFYILYKLMRRHSNWN